MSKVARLYLHSNGETISVGFETENDILLVLNNEASIRDRVILKEWVEWINGRIGS